MGRRPRLSFPSARSGSRRPLDYAESLSRHLHAATGAKKITRHNPGLGIMPESAAGGGLREAGPQDGDPDGALDDGLVKVMAVTPARDRMAVGPGGGEDPLPGPFAGSRRIGAVRAIGQVDPTGAAGDVHFVEPPSKVELSREVGLGARGEDRHAALGSRSAADRDRVAREIDVFDPQAAALE